MYTVFGNNMDCLLGQGEYLKISGVYSVNFLPNGICFRYKVCCNFFKHMFDNYFETTDITVMKIVKILLSHPKILLLYLTFLEGVNYMINRQYF